MEKEDLRETAGAECLLSITKGQHLFTSGLLDASELQDFLCPFQPLKFLIWFFFIHSILSFPLRKYTRCCK